MYSTSPVQVFSSLNHANFDPSSPLFILQLAKKLHPDTNKDDPDAEKKFQEVQKAYEVIFSIPEVLDYYY